MGPQWVLDLLLSPPPPFSISTREELLPTGWVLLKYTIWDLLVPGIKQALDVCLLNE